MISLDAIVDLPPDDEEAFLRFEEHARAALSRKTETADREQSWQPFWLAYMTEIQEAANEFAIAGFEDWNIRPPIEADEFNAFENDVYAITTRLKFRVARRRRGEVDLLEGSDREKINFRIRQLREQIEASQIPDEKRKELIKKLDELTEAFAPQRVNRASVLVALTALAALLGTVQGQVLKGPETIVAIMDSINMVIGKEEERRALLERYRKPLVIEDKSKSKHGNKETNNPEIRFVADLDDEIPF